MLTTDRVRELYERHVRALTNAERLQLLALVTTEMAESAERPTAPSKRRPLSIVELHGVAKASADGSDAQDFVNTLREEWDHRSW